jgi:hypothetical protein
MPILNHLDEADLVNIAIKNRNIFDIFIQHIDFDFVAVPYAIRKKDI